MHACSALLMRTGVAGRTHAQGKMAAANTHAEWQRNASEMEAVVHAHEPHWERTLFDYELVAHRLEVRAVETGCTKRWRATAARFAFLSGHRLGLRCVVHVLSSEMSIHTAHLQ